MDINDFTGTTAAGMNNLYKRFSRQSTWGEFSQRLCKFYRLPHGSRFVLAGPDRAIREDKIVARKPISANVLSRDDRQTVREMLDEIEAMLSINLADRGWTIVPRGPANVEVPHNTRLRGWRAMEPAPTEVELAARRARREEIDDFLRPQVARWFEELDEGIDEPQTKVPEAVLAELVERYGVEEVRTAIGELRV